MPALDHRGSAHQPARVTATCALHPEVPSEAVCSRCGRFCCGPCLGERQPLLCVACVPLALDPLGLRSARFDPVSALLPGLRLAVSVAAPVFALCVAFSIPAALLQTYFGQGEDLKSVGQSLRLSSLFDALLGVIGSQAALALVVARSEGRALSLGGAFQEGLGNWGRCLGARIRSGLWIFLFALLLVVPGIWKGVLLAFTSVAALRSQEADPLEQSEALVRGRFWEVFLFFLLAGAVLYLPVFVAIFGVGMLGELVELPTFATELFGDSLERFVSDGLMGGVMLAAYVQLHGGAGVPLAPMRWRTAPAPISSTALT